MAQVKTFPAGVGIDSSGGNVSLVASAANSRSAGNSPKRGTSEILRAYAEMPWLRAVTKRVAESTADVCWRLYRETNARGSRAASIARIGDDGIRRKAISNALSDAEIEPVDTHPLLDLLERGNPIHDGRSIRLLGQVNYDLTGEGYAMIELDGSGVPSSLWPIPASWVQNRPQEGKPFFKIRPPSSGVETNVPAELMVQLVDFDPFDPYGRGVGTARSLADELDTDEAAAKHVRQWFANGARPDLIVSADGLTKDDVERLEQSWTQKLGGFLNRFRPFFVSRRVEVMPISQTFEQMGLVDLRRFERDVVIEVFGVPPEILGIITNSNRATSEAADYHFAKWVVTPRASLQRAAFQRSLVPLYQRTETRGLILDFDSPVDDDATFQLSVMGQVPHAFRVNEAREVAGFAPLSENDGGELFAVDFTRSFVERLEADDLDLAPEPAPPEPEPEEPEEPEDDEMPEGAGDGEGEEGDEDGERAAILRIRKAAIELSVVDRIVRALTGEEMTDALQPVIADTVERYGRDMADSIAGVEFDVLRPSVVEFIQARAAERVARVTATTRKSIRRELLDGVRAGEGIEPLAARVRNVFDVAGRVRSRAIARTETVRAANFGNFEALRQTDTKGKLWISSRDGEVRDTHNRASGLDGTVVPVGADFRSASGAAGPYPGALGTASEDINCRCTIIGAEIGERNPADELTEKQKSAIWKRGERKRVPLERRMQRAARRAFAAEMEAVLTALEENAR